MVPEIELGGNFCTKDLVKYSLMTHIKEAQICLSVDDDQEALVDDENMRSNLDDSKQLLSKFYQPVFKDLDRVIVTMYADLERTPDINFINLIIQKKIKMK